MGIGRAKGENRVIEAVRQAVSSPLLETTIEGAKSVILNVTGGKDLKLSEVNEAAVLVQGIIDSGANIIFGETIDENMSEEIKITVIATGFSSDNNDANKIEFADKPANDNVPPLLSAIEEQERKAAESEKIIEPQETNLKNDNYNMSEEEIKAEETETKPAEEKKGRELPAFMKKLLGRK